MPRHHVGWGLLVAAAAAVGACQPQRGTAPVADGTSVGSGRVGEVADDRRSRARKTRGETARPSGTHPADSVAPAAPVQTARRPTPDSEAGDAEGARDEHASPAAPGIETINANPQRLLGADGPGLRARLGEPARRRTEAATQVWQYRLGQCVLDIVLYPENGGMRAAHVEARDRDGKAMATRRCLHALLTRQGGTASAQP